MTVEEIAERYVDKVEQIRQLTPTDFELLLRGKESFALTVRIRSGPTGGYIPELSHHVKAGAAAGAHAPNFGQSKTVEEALEEAILRGLMFYRPDDESAVFEYNPSFA